MIKLRHLLFYLLAGEWKIRSAVLNLFRLTDHLEHSYSFCRPPLKFFPKEFLFSPAKVTDDLFCSFTFFTFIPCVSCSHLVPV